MQANAYDLTTIFGSRRQMFIPIYQRPYVWEEGRQWSKLWEDIIRNAELVMRQTELKADKIRPHFMGAVVLDHHLTPLGKPEAKSVIDGQQRLTTLSLVLLAIRDLLSDKAEAKHLVGRLDELLLNKHVDAAEDAPKVMPTNVDRSAYLTVIEAGSPSTLKAKAIEAGLNPNGKIIGAYLYFFKRASDWINGQPDGGDWKLRAEAVVNTITQRMRIVVIDIDNHDESQVIFETLNARGTPLLQIDLVKNYLFRAAKEEGHDVNALYRKYWMPFEKDDSFWRRAISVGRLSVPVVEVFLQHYLTLQAMKAYTYERLFDGYKEWDISLTGDTYDWHLSQLAQYAAHYRTFSTASPDTREGIFFQRIAVMETTTVYPLLLWLYERTKTEPTSATRVACLDLIESFLVRRLMCRLTTKNYNQFFMEITASMRKSEEQDIVNDLARLLTKSGADSARFPTEEEFRKAFREAEAYRRVPRARLAMVLKAIDSRMLNPKSEDVPIRQKLSIEHIMPQDWEKHWPLAARQDESPQAFLDRKAIRGHLLQTIGNLTLVTQPLNSSVSNSAFPTKAKEIQKSKLNMNIELVGYSDWSETEIRQRSDHLFEVARCIWPYRAAGQQNGAQGAKS